MKGLSILVVAFATFILLTEATSSNVHGRHARALETLTVEPKLGMKISEPINVELEGEFYWKLLYSIDNRGKDNPYKETLEVAKTITTSYSELKDSVYEQSVKANIGLEVNGLFEIINIGVKGSVETDVTRSYHTTVNKKSETTVTRKVTHEFTVGANSTGEMYMLVYQGPGVSYDTDTVSTNNSISFDKVIIKCEVKNIYLLKNIGVKYAEKYADIPDDVITETTAGNPDINAYNTGRLVFLYPIWVTKKDEAATSILFIHQERPDDNYIDLFPDYNHYYYYLKTLKNPVGDKRMNRVGLLRNHTRDDIKSLGWDDCTSDINENRDGGYLYLCWNVVS